MNEVGRRRALKLTLLGAAGFASRRLFAQGLETEVQYGDPGLPEEQLTFDPDAVLAKVAAPTRAAFAPRLPNFNGVLVGAAGEHVGESRETHRSAIERYLELFELPFAAQGKVVPFCAAGLSYVSAMLYARSTGVKTPSMAQLRNVLSDIDHHHFYPSPSVMDMKYVALGKRRWVARLDANGRLAPQPGWLVVYNWNGDGKSDHVGLVERIAGTTLHTIEFNTSATNDSNGGKVARRQRAFDKTVDGFIRPELVKPA
jgi:hypothetical protein